jgi:cytochrome c oxidase subunit I+III
MTDGHLPPKTTAKRWLVTTNHKDIGVLYILTALFFLLVGGALALLIRSELFFSDQWLLSGDQYNQAVTAHGLVMVFWFLSPFAFGFANYLVPLQIGADDLAFPRLNALSYWFYLISGLVVLVSFFQGGTFDGGWTAYAPLNLPAYTPSIGGTTAILGLFLFVVSVTLGTINFLTTIHRSRAEGMGLWNLPMFTWSILLTVWMMLFAFATLLAALLLLGSDRIVETVYFAGASEGGSLLWAHLFWFFGHPEVYIVFFPALGVMFEIFQTFCGRRIVGRKWVIISMILVAVQSFLVWMHHMFLTSINLEIKTLMMATTIAISLPFDLMVFALIYTMVKGRIRFKTPFLFALGALVLFIIGGITGVFLGAVVLDYEFRGTYWVVAHFHYVMFGGASSLFGALYYWYPKITGKMYNEFIGKVHFLVWFFGFNLLYFPLFVGWETPRRYFSYSQDLLTWHQLATVGGFITGVSFLIMFGNMAYSYFRGRDADGNPWAYTQTAEWAMPSPPPLENWDGRPSYLDGTLELVTDRAVPDGGATATGHDVLEGGEQAHEVETGHDVHADHASIWPFVISIGAFFLLVGLSGFQEFPTALSLPGIEAEASPPGAQYVASLAIGGATFFYGLYGFGMEEFHAPEMAVAERWPFGDVPKNKLGMWFFLASDVVVFGAVIGSYLFIRYNAGWMEWSNLPPSEIPGLVNTLVLLTSSYLVVMALEYADRGSKRGVLATLGGTFALGLTFLGIKAYEWYEEIIAHEPPITPWAGADAAAELHRHTAVEASVYYVTTGLHGLHVVMGLIVAGFMLGRVYFHDAYLENDEPIERFGLYWHFVDIVWVFLFPMFYLI